MLKIYFTSLLKMLKKTTAQTETSITQWFQMYFRAQKREVSFFEPLRLDAHRLTSIIQKVLKSNKMVLWAFMSFWACSGVLMIWSHRSTVTQKCVSYSKLPSFFNVPRAKLVAQKSFRYSEHSHSNFCALLLMCILQELSKEVLLTRCHF